MYVHSPPRGPSSVHPRLSGARKMVLANLRVQHGPLVATLVEGLSRVIMRVLYMLRAAVRASRV